MTRNDLLKKAEEYMKTKYRFELTEDEAEGGYIISYPDLVGCISTGETIEEAVKNGEIPQEQIDASVKRILKWKHNLGLI